MKRLLAGLLLLNSLSVFASEMQIEEVMLDTGEITALITEPKYPDSNLPVRFNYWKHQDGVCKLLGYQKAVDQSAIFSNSSERVLVLDENGKIVRSIYENKVTSIVCINKVAEAQGAKLSIVNEPKHSDSNLPVRFNYWKHQDGVCKLLGYQKAVDQSAIFSNSSERVLVLDENGKIVRSSYANKVTSIVCINN
jgi:DNA-binding transcriptional regulator of glucitol operon